MRAVLLACSAVAALGMAPAAPTIVGCPSQRLQVAGDGTVWYTDYGRSYLGALDPRTGKVREWRSPAEDAGPYGIAIGTDGRVWYCESRTGSMVAFDPGTEKMEVVTIPTPGAIVRHMQIDSTRGRIWLALSGTGRLGKIEVGRREADLH